MDFSSKFIKPMETSIGTFWLVILVITTLRNHQKSMGFPDFYGISMGFPWDFHGISRFLCPPWKRQETTAPMSQAERGNMEPTRWASVSCSTAKEVTPPSSEISEMGCPMMPPKWRAKRNPTTQQPTSGFLYFFCWVNVDSKWYWEMSQHIYLESAF